MIMDFFVFIIGSVILAGIAIYYRQYYITKKKCGLINAIKKQKAISITIGIVYILFAVLALVFYQEKRISFIDMIQYLLMWDCTFLIAVIDFELKKIPKPTITFLFVSRIIGIILNVLIYQSSLFYIGVSSLIGMLIAAITVFIVLFFSKGIGMGDLYLFSMIGFYFGLLGFIPIMIYTIFPAAIVSGFMLLFKKAEKKATIPLAPFIFIGLTIYYILL